MEASMTQARVTGEYYTVLTDVGSGRAACGETREGRYEIISDAVEAAMRITLDRKVGCAVQRITVHEPVQGDGFFTPERTTETVTGEISIPGPRSYNYAPELSRYHSANGWVVPDVVEVN
jgi:hypothetical protein